MSTRAEYDIGNSHVFQPMFYLQEESMNLFKQVPALIIVLLLMAGPLELKATETVSAPQISHDIEQLLRTKNLSIRGADILTQAILLEIYQEIYQDHDFAPYWTNPDRIRELMDLIQNSADHGLIPADYNIDQLHQVLQRRMARPSAEIEAEVDILLTESLLRYGYHRRFGKVHHRLPISSKWLHPRVRFINTCRPA